MQINLNSTVALGIQSISHIEELINNFDWNRDLLNCSVNIDSTLKDVDDLIYVQLVCEFENEKISYISDALNMTNAIKSAMEIISKKMIIKTEEKLDLKRKVHIAA